MSSEIEIQQSPNVTHVEVFKSWETDYAHVTVSYPDEPNVFSHFFYPKGRILSGDHPLATNEVFKDYEVREFSEGVWKPLNESGKGPVCLVLSFATLFAGNAREIVSEGIKGSDSESDIVALDLKTRQGTEIQHDVIYLLYDDLERIILNTNYKDQITELLTTDISPSEIGRTFTKLLLESKRERLSFKWESSSIVPLRARHRLATTLTGIADLALATEALMQLNKVDLQALLIAGTGSLLAHAMKFVLSRIDVRYNYLLPARNIKNRRNI
jgi:hypothetical protein